MPKKPALKPSKDDKTKVSTLVSPESTEKTTVRDTNTMGVSKKDKRKLKRQKLIQNLAKSVQQKKEVKEKVKKNTVLDNMSTLKEMLPTISESNISNFKAEKLTLKKKQDLAKLEQEQFKNVLKHPIYQSNPLATISEHIKNNVQILHKQQQQQQAIKPQKNTNKGKKKQ